MLFTFLWQNSWTDIISSLKFCSHHKTYWINFLINPKISQCSPSTHISLHYRQPVFFYLPLSFILHTLKMTNRGDGVPCPFYYTRKRSKYFNLYLMGRNAEWSWRRNVINLDKLWCGFVKLELSGLPVTIKSKENKNTYIYAHHIPN